MHERKYKDFLKDGLRFFKAAQLKAVPNRALIFFLEYAILI